MQQEHPSPLQLETKQVEIIHPLALMILCGWRMGARRRVASFIDAHSLENTAMAE